MKNWKIYHTFDPDIYQASKQQHLIARLIGLSGQSYLPEEPDYGHVTLLYHPELSALTGKQIPGNSMFSIAFSLKDLKLLFLDQSFCQKEEYSLDGKLLNDALVWIKSKIAEMGMNPQTLQDSFDNTPLERFEGKEIPFAINTSALKQNARYRHNADLVLQKYASHFEDASEIRTWPHHFDTATYIPLRVDEQGNETHSIGLGFAIPDTTVNEPYFYINVWTADGLFEVKNPEKLKGHGEWVQQGWKGAYLRLSSILEKESPEKQWKRINRFFESGIITILNSF